MKQLIFLIALIIGSSFAKAQMVVNDPVATKIATTGWTKSLAEATAQSKTLIETKKLLEQSVDIYNKVSSTLQNIQAVHNIIDRQVKMISLLSQQLSRNDISDIKSYKRYISILQNVVIEAQSTISMLNSFLSPNLSMSPGDRLKLILELDQQSREQLGKIQTKIRMYNRLNTACSLLRPTQRGRSK